MRVEIKDFGEAARKIQAMGDEIGQRIPSGLRVIGEEIMTDVKASRAGKGVPVDEGTLRSSGRVTGPTGILKAVVSLTFGGASAPYALKQHEELQYRHTVGEARYLVRGLERWQLDGSAGETALRENARQGIAAASRA